MLKSIMNKPFFIILLLLCSLLFGGVAQARLTLGVVGDDERARTLADNLARHLDEEVTVKNLADSATLLNWLERFAMVDLAVLPTAALSASPGRHLVLGQIGPTGEMSLVVTQGGGGDLPRRLDPLLRASGPVLWGAQAAVAAPAAKPVPTPVAALPVAVGEGESTTQGVEHLPPLRSGPAWSPESDASSRDILAAAESPVETLVLGVVLEPSGPLRTSEQVEALADYLQRTLQTPVTARVFARPETLTAWFSRYRMVDVAILPPAVAASVLERDYRPLAGMFRPTFATNEPASLVVARLDLDEAAFNVLQAALTDMAAHADGRRILAGMDVQAVKPPGALPEAEPIAVLKPQVEVPPVPSPTQQVDTQGIIPVESSQPTVFMAEPASKPQDEGVAPEAPVRPEELVLPAVQPGAHITAEQPVPGPPSRVVMLEITPADVADLPPPAPPVLPHEEIALPSVPSLPKALSAVDSLPAPAMPELPTAPEKLPEDRPPMLAPDAPPSLPSVAIAGSEVPLEPAPSAEVSQPIPMAPTETLTIKPIAPADIVLAPVAPAEVAAVFKAVTPETEPPVPADVQMTTPGIPAVAEPSPPVPAAEELQQVVEELIASEGEVAAVEADSPMARRIPQAGSEMKTDDVIAMLGEDTVASVVAQPELPEDLRPPGIPVLQPGRIPRRTSMEDNERLVVAMPQPRQKTSPARPPSLLPEPEPEPGVVYVVPFVSIMVPSEVDSRIFDQFIDILIQKGAGLNLQFVILKEGLQRVDPNWLAVRRYVTGEIYAYVEDSGCCSTDLRTKARLTYRRPQQETPAFGFEYPVKRFFDHDRSTLEKERIALADTIAQTLADQLLAALKN